MSVKESISRFNLIVHKLRKSPATFAEIMDYLQRQSELHEYKFVVSKRQFQRDIQDINSLYACEIIFNRSSKVYTLTDINQPEMHDRMLEAFDMFNMLNVSDGLTNFIQLEKRRPKGTENIYGLLHAIKNKFQIKFLYQKFWEEEITQRTAEPYALKEFKNRWYILAKESEGENIKTFALDRLSNLEITTKVFELEKGYNIEESFRYCFGIISPTDEEPQEIILSFQQFQGKYIKTLPLHSTQQILIDTDDELQIKLKLCITHDLIMELLSYGETLQVIKPKSLAKQIKEAHENAAKQYK